MVREFPAHHGSVKMYKNGRPWTNIFLMYYSFLNYTNFILSNKLVFDMEDSKLKKILENFNSKINDMLHETFAKFEHSLRDDIVNLRNDLNNVKELNKKELTKLESLSMTLKMVKNSLRRNLKSKKRR